MENITTVHLEDKVENIILEMYTPTTDTSIQKNITEFAGKFLVLFFYPADFTFVCPTELKDLNKSYEDIKATNSEILVVSTDTIFSHKRWIETEHLLENFKIQMVSDRKWDLSRMFWVMNNQSGNSARWTFIISPDGILKDSEIVTEPLGRSSNELVRKLRALEFMRTNPGQACPANWNIGEQTLMPSIKIAGHVAEQLN